MEGGITCFTSTVSASGWQHLFVDQQYEPICWILKRPSWGFLFIFGSVVRFYSVLCSVLTAVLAIASARMVRYFALIALLLCAVCLAAEGNKFCATRKF